MELLDVITLFGVLGVIITSSMVLIFRVIPAKSPKKQAEADFIRISKANSNLVDEINTRKDAMMKSIQSENTRLKKELYAEATEEPEESGISPEILAQVSKEVGIPQEQLMLMAEIPQIKKLLGKDPNKTIMQYAPLLRGFLNKKNGNSEIKLQGM